MIKILLLWWIITVAVRWYRRFQAEKTDRPSMKRNESNDTPGDRLHSGKIEDADFEEIDDRKRQSS